MIEPISNYVLVELSKQTEKVESSLIVVHSEEMDKVRHGDVKAIGEGKKSKRGNLLPMTVKVGHDVYFLYTSGTLIKLNGKEHIILSEDEIIAFEEKN